MQTIVPTIQASSELPSIWDRTQRILNNFGLPKWVRRQQKQATVVNNYHIDARGSSNPATVNAQITQALRQAAPHITAASLTAQLEQKLRQPENTKSVFTIPEGLSAADYAKGVVKADETKKNIAAHLDLATLSRPSKHAATLKDYILVYVDEQFGPVTAREIYENINCPMFAHYSTVTTRVSELAKAGLITYTGKITRNGKQVNGYVAGGK